jgi:alginate O-acetyltransferase complex protein AlgI
MAFTSLTFLLVFLPILLVLYWLVRRTAFRNALLFAASLVFYTWGGSGRYVPLVLLSIAANYVFGLWLEPIQDGRRRRLVLALAVAVNLAPLIVLKYGAFLVGNANGVLRRIGIGALPLPGWSLPVGISFFTFMALSYVIAVARKELSAERKPFRLALFISMFPLIMAGPIARFRDLAPQLPNHPGSRDAFALGVRRFSIGLAKKLLIANTLATLANAVFAADPSRLSTPVAWLGLVCYTLQIYFDFSGYSDMAIGLGRMFGLRIVENFDYPYAARSLRVFWTRWHISLSTWFRDYVFLPVVYPASRLFERVGCQARKGDFWAYSVATLTTMLLIGLWHGASWVFVLWGLYHGVFLALERTRLGRRLGRLPVALQHVYTVLVVMGGWVLFRAKTLGHALGLGAALTGNGSGELLVGTVLTTDVVLALVVGVVGATRLPIFAKQRIEQRLQTVAGVPGTVLESAWALLGVALVAALMVLSSAVIAAGTFAPFIYFGF